MTANNTFSFVDDKNILKCIVVMVAQLCEYIKNYRSETSLVAQWLRIHLPMQGTQVQSLVWEDPTCRGATKPVRHNY